METAGYIKTHFYLIVAIANIFLFLFSYRILKVKAVKTLMGMLVFNIVLAEFFMMSVYYVPFMLRFIPKELIIEGLYWKSADIMQFEEECARYDPELTYTLKPGRFFFSNPEFKNEFRVNTAGLRDDEESLVSPDIIVLGDSYAMGWGVEQDETYAQAIERKSPSRVLNAAVASYGTVREMMLLERLDTANVKTLIIHYQGNDTAENRAFYENGNKLTIRSEDAYNKARQVYLREKRYYPFKYLLYVAKEALGRLTRRRRVASSHEGEVDLFINALTHASDIDLEKIEIIVLGERGFIPLFEEKKRSKGCPGFIGRIKTITTEEVLDEDCYHVMDKHYNAKGHELLAERILRELQAP